MALANKNVLAWFGHFLKYPSIAILLIMFLTSGNIVVEGTRYGYDISKADYALIDHFRDYEWSDPTYFIDERSQDENENFIDPPSELIIDGDLIIGGNITHCFFDMPVTVHGSLVVERFIEITFNYPLVVEGDLVVSGNLLLSSDVTVGGEIIVFYGSFWQGNFESQKPMRCFSLVVRDGDAYIDSIISVDEITIGGDLHCDGNLTSEKGSIKVQGDMFVDGNLHCRWKLTAGTMFIDGNCFVGSEVYSTMGGIHVGGDLEAHDSVTSMGIIEVKGNITGWSTISAGAYFVLRNRDFFPDTINCNRLLNGDVIFGELIETSKE